MDEPPSESGAAQLTRIVAAPGVSVTCTGFDGTVLGVTFDEEAASELPALFVATTSTT
jgi:hypothetical protein